MKGRPNVAQRTQAFKVGPSEGEGLWGRRDGRSRIGNKKGELGLFKLP